VGLYTGLLLLTVALCPQLQHRRFALAYLLMNWVFMGIDGHVNLDGWIFTNVMFEMLVIWFAMVFLQPNRVQATVMGVAVVSLVYNSSLLVGVSTAYFNTINTVLFEILIASLWFGQTTKDIKHRIKEVVSYVGYGNRRYR